MRSKTLSPRRILVLAGVKPSKDLLKLATWCSNNLVLLEDDCPHCGQSADECDEDPCDKHAKEIVEKAFNDRFRKPEELEIPEREILEDEADWLRDEP